MSPAAPTTTQRDPSTTVQFKWTWSNYTRVAVSFDLFGTLVTADRPAEPWTAVADALRDRDVAVPADWQAAYRSSHWETEPLAAAPLDEHVRLALESRGVTIDATTAREATLAAFDGPVELRDGARVALAAARRRGPVAVCSNCGVPGLVERTVEAVEIEPDAVLASVDVGWRKPHERIFEATASALDVPLGDLVHVGDDPRTDGGADRAGATALLLSDRSLTDLPDWLATLEADP